MRQAAEGGQGANLVWRMGQVAGGVGKVHGENNPETDARL